MDSNSNGIPDSHENWFLVARGVILAWSLVMLTASYFVETKVDKTFVVTTFTAAAASFGLKNNKQQSPNVPQGRTEVPTEFLNK